MTAKLSHSLIIDALEELSRNDLISIHNDYCQTGTFLLDLTSGVSITAPVSFLLAIIPKR